MEIPFLYTSNSRKCWGWGRLRNDSKILLLFIPVKNLLCNAEQNISYSVLADYKIDLPSDRDEETSFYLSFFFFLSSSLPLQPSLPLSAAPPSCPLIPAAQSRACRKCHCHPENLSQVYPGGNGGTPLWHQSNSSQHQTFPSSNKSPKICAFHFDYLGFPGFLRSHVSSQTVS